MIYFLIFISLFLKIFPYLIIIKKLKNLGEYLNQGVLFLGIVLLAFSPNIIRNSAQMIAVFFLGNDSPSKYLNIYFLSDCSYSWYFSCFFNNRKIF